MSVYKNNVLDFLNVVVKDVLRKSSFTQIGRLPKFFLPTEKKIVTGQRLESWPGYLSTARLLSDGIFLNIDTCTKFVN